MFRIFDLSFFEFTIFRWPVLVTCRSRVICKKVASRSGTIGAQSEKWSRTRREKKALRAFFGPGGCDFNFRFVPRLCRSVTRLFCKWRDVCKSLVAPYGRRTSYCDFVYRGNLNSKNKKGLSQIIAVVAQIIAGVSQMIAVFCPTCVWTKGA